MRDSKNGLEKLIAPCQRSVQCPCCPLHSPFGQKLPTVVPSPPIPRATIDPAAVIVPCSDVKQNLSPTAHATCSTISRNTLPRANSCPPVVLSLQPPIATSLTAYTSRETPEPSTPIDHTTAGQKSRKDGIKIQTDSEIHIRYRDVPWRTLHNEVKRRGLLIAGTQAELTKRLEKDDEFQANLRTAEDYDTMDPTNVYRLCVLRSVPSNGTDSLLRDRLKAHDKRRYEIESTGPRSSSSVMPSGPISVVDYKGCQDTLKEKLLVSAVKNISTRTIEVAETIGQATEMVTRAIAKEHVGINPIKGMLPSRNIHEAYSDCRKSKVCKKPTT